MGQVALEGNFRFVLDKSDLKSASDKKFVRKATVALQNKICEQNTTPCCERLVISRDFPRSCLYSLFTPTKPRHEGSKKMLPRRILAVIVFYFFLVLQQQANINLMIWCLLFMQNLQTQNLLLTREFAVDKIVIEEELHIIGLLLVQSNRGSRSITLIGQYQGTTFEGFYE